MKRIFGLAVVSGALLLTAGSAGATSLSLSIGSGGLLNPNGNQVVNVAPIATELSVGFNVAPNVTLDANFLFARDLSNPYSPNLGKSSYVGFRPGIRAYGGHPWQPLRPYFRAAVPFQYRADSGTADIGILLGGGLEYRFGRSMGIFGEAVVSPYLTNDNLIPIEGRVGVAVHF